MNGRRVLWVPGTDHAGIATQSVVEKKIFKEEKKTKHDFTREEFVKRVWEWKAVYGNRITSQLRRMGSSLDWSRECFTMDPKLSRAVTECFVRMFDSGLIYRAHRLVNWSCKLRTAISDIEVEYVEVPGIQKMRVPGYDKPVEVGFIYEFAYKLKDGSGEIIVGTTRPETMLGDTAVAVHPEDPRYKNLIGKELSHPFIPERKMKIIADDKLVDMNFGTGAVKITPAHDPNDYECGKRHELEFITILNVDGTINENGGEFKGMRRYDARSVVMEKLKALGLERSPPKNNPMRLATCSRSGDIIEPLLLPQWWVSCKELATESANAVRNGEIEIVPEQHKAVWYHWLDNIRDWCISRQLLWGHRIPAWKVLFADSAVAAAQGEQWSVARDDAEARQRAEAKFPGTQFDLKQDDDVLDTWFSSGLFPFSTLGWPDVEPGGDFDKYYPTSLLETGHDIIFFWVARMVMMGKFCTGKWPFKQVLLHAMVRDAHGRKMSKSLGNVIDPVHVIEGITLEGLNKTLDEGNLDPREVEVAKKGQAQDFPLGISECGTDALRFALCAYTSQGRDINLDINRVVAYRNFCNKIWNATKLARMVFGAEFVPRASAAASGNEGIMDKWILSRLNHAAKEIDASFKEYDFSRATGAIYSFWLYDLCDVYLEAIKPVCGKPGSEESKSAGARAAQDTLYTCLEEGLRLLSPFMCFLTEELWQRLPKRDPATSAASICVAPFPLPIAERAAPEIEAQFTEIMESVHAIRSLRTEYNIIRKMAPPTTVNTHSEKTENLFKAWSLQFKTLSYSGEVTIARELAVGPEGAALAIPNASCELHVVLRGSVDADQEIAKLKKKYEATDKQLATLQKRRTGADYEKKVPESIREEETKKYETLKAELENINKTITNFEKLAKQ
jgi:valyl-tRNA synthetase